MGSRARERERLQDGDRGRKDKGEGREDRIFKSRAEREKEGKELDEKVRARRGEVKKKEKEQGRVEVGRSMWDEGDLPSVMGRCML